MSCNLLVFFSLFIVILGLERELKVHNIILYPERHSWCQTTPIQQVITAPGYTPTTISNHVCVGACYSYSIPQTQPAEPSELIGPYCDSCQPVTTKCFLVTLKSDEDPLKTLQKRVEIIEKCSCSACNRHVNVITHCQDELPSILRQTNDVDIDDTATEPPDHLLMMGLNLTTLNLTNGTNGKKGHFVGELIEDRTNGLVGRLVKGPHGGLVLKPSEKINIDLQDEGLEPNHDGMVITYETQSIKSDGTTNSHMMCAKDLSLVGLDQFSKL